MADEGLCLLQPRCSEIQAVASDVFVTRVRLVFDRSVLKLITDAPDAKVRRLILFYETAATRPLGLFSLKHRLDARSV
jgi:hypothetical protein